MQQELSPAAAAAPPLAPDEVDIDAAADAQLRRTDEVRQRRVTKRVPMKEAEADRDVREAACRVHADELRQFIERYERLAEEKAELAADQKDVMAEAKARGYDTRVIRRIIAMRKRDKDDLDQEQAILDLYCEALGMA